MTSPTDRTERFSLRLSPDERAIIQDIQGRLGPDLSENSVIALLIAEAYHWRAVARSWPALPLDETSWDYVRDTADEVGITTADALALLILRGAPHQPQKDCLTPKSGFRQVPDHLPHPPRYATPKPAALPIVPPVPGQIHLTESDSA